MNPTIQYGRNLVLQICDPVILSTWVDDLQTTMDRNGVAAAVENHDTPKIFDWLMNELSFQGISDSVAEGYLAWHGNVTWTDIDQSIRQSPRCPKLQGYWAFTGCRYQKSLQTCDEPRQFADCPLPKHPLRNGRLNQTAYSLFLFIRDVAGGNLVEWIDRRLTGGGKWNCEPKAVNAALVDPLRNVYGASDKVMSMVLAGLLLGAGHRKHGWVDAGANLVVIDTLVHNFLHRTGVLRRLKAAHSYGPACYQSGGCAGIVVAIATGIDARQFNSTFPKTFPRLIQSAIWRHCSQAGVDICNGNQIDDRDRCENTRCTVFTQCDRVPLHVTAKTRAK